MRAGAIVFALVLAGDSTAPGGGLTPPTFASRVEAVYVDVFVTSGSRAVTGLSAADFELRDDGRRQQVELVSVESLPLAIYVVLDTSGSVKGEKLEQLRSAVAALFDSLRPSDEATLLTFDQQVRRLLPQTAEQVRLRRAVQAIEPGGPTALFDALYTGTLLASSGAGRSLLVLFSDGEDNMSWLRGEEVRRVLEESNVLVQAVGVVPQPAELGDGPPAAEPPQAVLLRQLAETTGGRLWPADAPEGLTRAFLGIVESMRTRYVLRFEPPSGRRPGRHELDVKLVRRRGKVHCRKAYFVGPLSR